MTASGKKQIKLLILEDNKSDVLMIQRHLSRAQLFDFDVSDTDYVKSALMMLTNPVKNKQFDLIFLDMNVMDSMGHATVQDIHSAFPNIPIIVLSGHEDIRVADETLKCGARAFLVKKSASDFYPANPTEQEKARANKAITDELERTVMQVMRIHKQACDLSDLTDAAVRAAGGVQADPANISLTLASLEKLDEALAVIRRYIHKNHPIAWDALKPIFQRDINPTLISLRSSMDTGSRPPQKPVEVVAELTSAADLYTNTNQAERAMLAALNIDPRALFGDDA